jgi:hypothetical protein
MSKNDNKDLPVQSGANPGTDDKRLQQQEEYDNRGKDEQQTESEVRNAQRTEQLRDSQQGDERMLSDSKAKPSQGTHQAHGK